MLRLLTAGLWLMCGNVVVAETTQLNVLFIAIDDLNTRLGCYGVNHISSPNIDRLAARGVSFQRAYCQYPSCGPSRASVLTGLRPGSTRVLSNKVHFRDFVPDAVTLPQLFRRHGYFVSRVGKIYHQANPTHIGTSGPDDPVSWDHVVNPRGRDKDEEDLLTVYTPQLPLPDQMCFLKAAGADTEQTDGKVADATIRLLKEHREEPFFIAAGFYRPHIPYIAPKRYFDLYDLDRTPLPIVPQGYRRRVPPAALASTPQWPNFGTTERQARECILAYDACVSFADAQVGRLLHALEDLGLADNTVVVLWGDHGYHLGEHGLWRKNSLYEESARAPLVMAGPGIAPASHECSAIVEFVDIYPTVAELVGIAPPDSTEGRSLTPLLRNPDVLWNHAAFTETHFRDVSGHAIRTARWRCVEWGERGEEGVELYDETADRLEMKNLAGDPAYSEILIQLRKQIGDHWN